MSKIICDVCGSAYADTASQCPICGTAKRDTSVTKPEAETVESSSYNYVKGGRFSHANVRKHNSGKELNRKPAEKSAEESKSNMPPLPVAPKPAKQERPQPVREEKPRPAQRKEPEKNEKAEKTTNIILAVIVLILLALVIYAAVYVVQHYDELFPSATDPSDSVGSSEQTVGGVRIPCVGITLPALEQLESDGAPVKLDISFTPSTTTDDKSFVSSDPSIADVDKNGVITVYATGDVTITVTCGDQTAELVLHCVLLDPSATTDPTQPTVPSIPDGALKFVNANNKEATDVTFSKYGEEYQLYKGDVDASLVTFTSSDPSIVTIDATGKIKIVGKGVATVYAECGDQKIECKIICTNVEVPVETHYEISFVDKKNKEPNEIDYTRGDVTIYVGDSIMIQLMDRETGAPVSGLTWYQSMPGTGYLNLEDRTTGVRVTGTDVTVGVKGVAYVRVMCDYEGVTYTCIVRVKAKPAEE